MSPATLSMIVNREVPKGDVFGVARIAGIMAAKRTSELIPLCHPLNISSVAIDVRVDHDRGGIEIQSTVKVAGQTGVEMEALTSVAAAALAIYDMCKAIDRDMVISEVMLIEKRGGRSGTYRRKSTGGGRIF